MAKPVEGVAGSGEHTHLGVSARLKNRKIINLFSAVDQRKDFLNPIGFGGLMGLLKNYEAINPFVSPSNDSLNRLKPGYEAPVCIVTSLGHSPEEPSRNRTILAGLVRDLNNPMATRFELRSPNPKSNTYLVLAVSYMAMLDGIKSALEAHKTPSELEKSISKKKGVKDFYLDTDREYRSEKDVFEDFTEEERSELFGVAPATVWENIQGLYDYPEKREAVSGNGVIPPIAIESFAEYAINQWKTELHDRIIPDYMRNIRGYVMLHGSDATDYDHANWDKIQAMKLEIAKDSLSYKSLLSRVKDALDEKNYKLASDLQIELQNKMSILRSLYVKYRQNLF
jgi:glutamine synthetase